MQFLEQSLRLCIIVLIEQFELLRYKHTMTLSFQYRIVSVKLLFPAGKLTSLMTVWADSLMFQFLLEIKMVSFLFLTFFLFFLKPRSPVHFRASPFSLISLQIQQRLETRSVVCSLTNPFPLAFPSSVSVLRCWVEKGHLLA